MCTILYESQKAMLPFKSPDSSTRRRVNKHAAALGWVVNHGVCLPTTIKWNRRGAPLKFRRKSGRVEGERNLIHYPRAAACEIPNLRLWSH